MDNALDAVAEIFTWVGFGLGILIAGAALLAVVLDGTWVPVRAVVERLDGRALVRWFDEHGDVNEAVLSAAEEHEVGGKDMVDVFARRGSAHRMRLHRRSPIVRMLVTLAAVLLGVGAAAAVGSLVLLFARG